MRKEKLQQTDQKVDIENTASDATLRGALLRGTEDKGYPCPRCKKRYNDEDKLKAHLASHGKVHLIQYSFKFFKIIHFLIRESEQNIHFVYQIYFKFLNVHVNNYVCYYLFRQRKRTIT